MEGQNTELEIKPASYCKFTIHSSLTASIKNFDQEAEKLYFLAPAHLLAASLTPTSSDPRINKKDAIAAFHAFLSPLPETPKPNLSQYASATLLNMRSMLLSLQAIETRLDLLRSYPQDLTQINLSASQGQRNLVRAISFYHGLLAGKFQSFLAHSVLLVTACVSADVPYYASHLDLIVCARVSSVFEGGDVWDPSQLELILKHLAEGKAGVALWKETEELLHGLIDTLVTLYVSGPGR